jgi:hypothetical protein
MNSVNYMAVLRSHLLPWMPRLGVTKFLQEGAPCHTSKKVKAILKESNVSVMDWPCNLLDLKPIKNLWAIMKSRLKKLPNITSLPLLIKAIKMMWTRDLPIAFMKKLACSMPARLKMCLKNKGQMTKY